MDTAARLAVAIRPWRTATVFAVAIAALELLVIAGAAVWFVAKPFATAKRDAAVRAAAHAPAARPTRVVPAAAAPAAAVKLARDETSVLVLNGNGRAGAAAAEAAKVDALGYVVGGTGNATRSDYVRTTVMYRPGYRGEGLRLAKDLGTRVVGPLDGLKPANLLGAQIVVIVGTA